MPSYSACVYLSIRRYAARAALCALLVTTSTIGAAHSQATPTAAVEDRDAGTPPPSAIAGTQESGARTPTIEAPRQALQGSVEESSSPGGIRAPQPALAPFATQPQPYQMQNPWVPMQRGFAPQAMQGSPMMQSGIERNGQFYPPQNPFMPAWLPGYARALTDSMPRAPLSGNVEENAPRPDWIPAYAYTNAHMVAEYHNMDIFLMDHRPIPNKPQWMRLGPNVIRYWRGYKVEPFWVKTVPDLDHPGNFLFFSSYNGGPRGWLEPTAQKGRMGCPMYRYWFDQPNSAPAL